MGNNSSSLSPQSQANSTFQQCLNTAFASNTDALSFPQDALYASQAVKLYNLDIPVIPAAVVRPSTPEDVAAAVKCAVDNAVKVQARGGGHSYGNYCLGGTNGELVVDMVNFQQFSMDNTTWQATVGSGTLLADLTTRLNNAGGRAIAHGTCPQVGLGGHATIGGLGPLSRQWGAALDHVLEVEVVLANSSIVRASETQNSDIFFAMKGAAAGFGIITEFVLETHPAPGEMVQYSYNFALGSKAAMASTFAAWQHLIADPSLTRKLATQVIVFELGMLITGTYFGSKSEYDALGFEQALAGNNATVKTTVINDWLAGVANWAEDEALQLVGGISGSFTSKSLTFRNDTLIPRNTINDVFQWFDADKDTLIWFVIFDLEAGATNDIPTSATAYAHRDTLFYIQTYAVGLTGLSNTTRSWIENINTIIINGMASNGITNWQPQAYPGYVDPSLGQDGQQQYWGTNLPKLEQIKKEIDPNDVFHNPQSVRPAA